MTQRIQVAVGVVKNATGEVLLAQRPADKMMAGRWEFPGGKLEPNESAAHALKRELREELGIEVERSRPLIALNHDYPDLSVALQVFLVERYSGTPAPLEQQTLAWAPIDELSQWALLEADYPIISALRLPDRCAVTSHLDDHPDAYLRHIEAALKDGLAMLQCRLPQETATFDNASAFALRGLCRQHEALFIWNGGAADATRLGADGLHLSATRLMALDSRPEIDGWVGASCHTEAEIHQANQLQLDYVFIGTVQPTPSHPDGPVLGWQGFGKLAAISNIPAFAIGGMTVADIAQSQARGGQGIAAIRSLLG